MISSSNLEYLKIAFRKLKRFVSRTSNRAKSLWIVWRTKPLTSSLADEAHVLVVKNKRYAPIAKICLESFCFYNSTYVVVVHFDSSTEDEVKKNLKGLIRKNRVRLVLVPDQLATWQNQKLHLICSLSGSTSNFMDADLKWNGALPEVSGVTFFVNEFQLDEDTTYCEQLSKIFPEKKFLGTMKNSSFFTWAGHGISGSEKRRIFEIERLLFDFFTTDPDSGDTNSGVARMSEQLALSLAMEEMTHLPINFLKSVVGFKDGSFVESSYFGATGATF